MGNFGKREKRFNQCEQNDPPGTGTRAGTGRSTSRTSDVAIAAARVVGMFGRWR